MKKMTTYFHIIPVALMLCVSCTKSTYNAVGSQPENNIAYSVISLRAEQSSDNTISMTLIYGEDRGTKNIYVSSSKPMAETCTISISSGDEKDVDDYSKDKGIEYQLLPKDFYAFVGGNQINIREDAQESLQKQIVIFAKNNSGDILAQGRYLLPLVGTTSGQDLAEDKIWIEVTIREKYTDPDGFELYTGEDMFTVFYLNTSQFDPRLANDMILMTDMADPQKPQYGIGNIVNLRTASVHYDGVTGNVSVRPSNDLRYVLDHYTERVLPVQESGRKVCVCIEGGGKGIGFCNFTKEQITEFAASVKKMVNTYGLDGINLWDRNSGYDKAEENGFPEMNTESYPKLIETLRNELGPDKLITITDYEEPTAYFHDVAKCGNIKVGKLIDYAWSGYCDGREPVQIVDPWHHDASMVSKLHLREPFAGLDKKHYGCVHATWYGRNSVQANAEVVKEWVKAALNPNGITVYYDIRSIIQDQFEGSKWNPSYILKQWYDSIWYDCNTDRLSNNESQPNFANTQYNKWVKDW